MNDQEVEAVAREWNKTHVLHDKVFMVCACLHLESHDKIMAALCELHAASEFATFDALGRDSNVARLRAAREAAAKVLNPKGAE